MDREELMRLMEASPVRIHMNDDQKYDIVHPREAAVSQISAYVMHRDPDGVIRAMVLPLVTMAGVEPLEPSETQAGD